MGTNKISLYNAVNNGESIIIKTICQYYQLALEMIEKNPYVLSNIRNLNRPLRKTDPDSNLTDPIYIRLKKLHDSKDRVFPLDTVTIKTHSINHKEELDQVNIHLGYNSDELVRSRGVNTIALAIGTDIYFRNGKYKPETEEGRALLAHELKHVSQYTEHRSIDNRTVEELEYEAEVEEKTEKEGLEPYIEMTSMGRTYQLTLEQYNKICDDAKRKLEERIIHEDGRMPEEDYLKLILKYERWEKREPIDRETYIRKHTKYRKRR